MRCPAVLLLALAGCASPRGLDTTLFPPSTSGGGHDRVVVVAPTVAVERVVSALHGIGAEIQPGGPPFICTRGGSRFRVEVEPLDDSPEQSRVRVEWDGSPDEATGFAVLAALDLKFAPQPGD